MVSGQILSTFEKFVEKFCGNGIFFQHDGCKYLASKELRP